ncbi:Acid phosphatase [Oopsacas minuta]|uniref:Acid phosphatase n=1 Tax=Oopsacas minuta TaxID=111878 RepID=A0AAV7KIG6_9METZ|nr:Acid phosphatase [Oopsacas minuta]
MYSILLSLLVCQLAFRPAVSDLHFQVFGDWGMGNKQQKLVAMAMMKNAVITKPNFIVNVGDNFYKHKDSDGEKQGGVNNLEDPLWKEYFESVYIDYLRNIPFYSLLGNHDYMGNISAQLLYHSKSPRWYLPSPSYHITVQVDEQTTALFVFLDTSPIIVDYYKHPENTKMADNLKKLDPKQQLEWLEHVLNTTSANWRFVVGHHPIISSTTASLLTEQDMNMVDTIIQKYSVQAYFSGHIHQLEHHNDNNIDYFISGAGATGRSYVTNPKGLRTLNWFGQDAGFLNVTLSKDLMTAQFLGTDLSVLHTSHTPII